VRRTREKAQQLQEPPTPEAPAPAAAPPPPGMLDMERVRFWAGRGPGRKNRPAYSITGGYDDVDPTPR
jgi:hypothetical protein